MVDQNVLLALSRLRPKVYLIFTALHESRRGLAMRILSVRLSVCLSVRPSVCHTCDP